MAVSAALQARRALVRVLLSLVIVYKLLLGITRDATDTEVLSAYKKVLRKAHPGVHAVNMLRVRTTACNRCDLFLHLFLAWPCAALDPSVTP